MSICTCTARQKRLRKPSIRCAAHPGYVPGPPRGRPPKTDKERKVEVRLWLRPEIARYIERNHGAAVVELAVGTEKARVEANQKGGVTMEIRERDHWISLIVKAEGKTADLEIQRATMGARTSSFLMLPTKDPKKGPLELHALLRRVAKLGQFNLG